MGNRTKEKTARRGAGVKEMAKRVTRRHVRRLSTGAFDAAYTRLNAAQRLAVDTIEGPVLCIAGPGTGKTEVIALRSANILRCTQMRPSNILCLTFSVSAATAMRERLRELIGADAYGVTMKNFHSFCNELILDHPLVFDEWSAYEPISDVERYRELNTIIDQLLPNLILVNPKSPYQRTREILERISGLKREGKTDRQELQRIADAYEAKMCEESREGTKQRERDLLAARKFHELLEIFVRYQEMLERTKRYDYEDMILLVLRALEEHSWLLASLQERYQYLLVDEFQDTNGAQAMLLTLLTTYPTLDHEPNLFVVGDDDQAIYRFQGANLQNLLNFRNRFPRAPVIPLTVSYRATQLILDAASRLIAGNTERLVGKIPGLTKDLRAASREKAKPPTLLRCSSERSEPWLIAQLVAERIQRGVPPQEVAILVQTNKELPVIHEALQGGGIPVQMRGRGDLLAHPLVKQAIVILRAIRNPWENSALAAALGCQCFGVHPADLGRMFQVRRERECALMEVLLGIESRVKNQEVEENRIPHSQFQILHSAALLSVRDVLLSLHQKLPSRTVVETLEHVLKDSHLLDTRSPEHFVPLQEFFERVKYRAYEDPLYSFETLLSDLQYYEHPEYRDLRLSYNLPHLTEAGVQLMTVHQSKGLEFEVVILAHFREGHWDRRRTPPTIALPEDLLFGWERSERRAQRHEDERRLAYVAVTRAKRAVLFTCPQELVMGEKVREVSPSAFFAQSGPLPEEMQEPRETATTLLTVPSLSFDTAFRAFLRERLETYALSVTALNQFIEDPQKFLEIDLLRAPQTKEPNLVYGNAVHEALRKWGLSVQQGTPLTLEKFLASFRTYLREREVLTEKERQSLLRLGEESLPRYYRERLQGTCPHIHKVECTIATHLGDLSDSAAASIPLKGKIDRIDLAAPTSAEATVIDFKTGRPQTESQIRNGDYFRQLQFYAVLLSKSQPLLVPRAFVLDFIGEGSAHPIERIFEVTEQEKKHMEELIRAVWSKILALDFTPL